MTPIPNDSSETTRLLQQLISQALNQARDSNALGSEDLQQLDPELFTRSVQSSPPPSILAPQRLYQSGTTTVLQQPSNAVMTPLGMYTGSYIRPERGKPENANFPILPRGKGTMVYHTGGYRDSFYPKQVSKYEGNWGIISYHNANISVYDGTGVLTFTDGTALSGRWHSCGRFDSRLNGTGILKFPDGSGINGNWFHGILRDGVQMFLNGDAFRGSFKLMGETPHWSYTDNDFFFNTSSRIWRHALWS